MVYIGKLLCENVHFGAICPPPVLGALWYVLQAALSASLPGATRVDLAAGTALLIGCGSSPLFGSICQIKYTLGTNAALTDEPPGA